MIARRRPRLAGTNSRIATYNYQILESSRKSQVESMMGNFYPAALKSYLRKVKFIIIVAGRYSSGSGGTGKCRYAFKDGNKQNSPLLGVGWRGVS